MLKGSWIKYLFTVYYALHHYKEVTSISIKQKHIYSSMFPGLMFIERSDILFI